MKKDLPVASARPAPALQTILVRHFNVEVSVAACKIRYFLRKAGTLKQPLSTLRREEDYSDDAYYAYYFYYIYNYNYNYNYDNNYNIDNNNNYCCFFP